MNISQATIKRVLLKVVVPYGVTWLVLAVLTTFLWPGFLSLWIVTAIVVIGACGDWFGEWLKSKQ